MKELTKGQIKRLKEHLAWCCLGEYDGRNITLCDGTPLDEQMVPEIGEWQRITFEGGLWGSGSLEVFVTNDARRRMTYHDLRFNRRDRKPEQKPKRFYVAKSQLYGVTVYDRESQTPAFNYRAECNMEDGDANWLAIRLNQALCFGTLHMHEVNYSCPVECQAPEGKKIKIFSPPGAYGGARGKQQSPPSGKGSEKSSQ